MRFELININELTAADYAAVLSAQCAAEQTRLERLREEDRRRSLAARYLAARLAKELYGQESFVPRFDKNGAPRADFCCLSLSHAGEYAACAVSESPVGIDIEPEGGFKPREKYMLFSEFESRFVNAGAAAAGQSGRAVGKQEMNAGNSGGLLTPAARFYTLWTMKEAFVKAAGGRLADAGKTELVFPDGADGFLLKKEFSGCRFVTERRGNYYISVCERLSF